MRSVRGAASLVAGRWSALAGRRLRGHPHLEQLPSPLLEPPLGLVDQAREPLPLRVQRLGLPLQLLLPPLYFHHILPRRLRRLRQLRRLLLEPAQAARRLLGPALRFGAPRRDLLQRAPTLLEFALDAVALGAQPGKFLLPGLDALRELASLPLHRLGLAAERRPPVLELLHQAGPFGPSGGEALEFGPHPLERLAAFVRLRFRARLPLPQLR